MAHIGDLEIRDEVMRLVLCEGAETRRRVRL